MWDIYLFQKQSHTIHILYESGYKSISTNWLEVIAIVVDGRNVWFWRFFHFLYSLTECWLPTASESFTSSQRRRLHKAIACSCSTRFGVPFIALISPLKASCGMCDFGEKLFGGTKQMMNHGQICETYAKSFSVVFLHYLMHPAFSPILAER